MLTCINENFPGLSIIGSSSTNYMSSMCACFSRGGFLPGVTCPGCPKWSAAINTPASKEYTPPRGFFFAHCSATSNSGLGVNLYIKQDEIISKLKDGSNEYKYDGTSATN